MQRLEILENIRDQYDSSEEAERLGLKFSEYEVLFRLKEGVKISELFSVLYCSPATIHRQKLAITKKLNAASFEQAFYFAVKSEII